MGKNVAKKFEDPGNPDLKNEVTMETPVKSWLVAYTATKTPNHNGIITVENVVNVLAEEFPEFLLAVAEENFIRGYNQAISDIEFDTGSKKAKRKKK